ncbi:MAG: hypothetical protein ACOH2K_10890 [Burkholderiaceae bacterium]
MSPKHCSNARFTPKLLLALSVFTATTAFAGPPVTVHFTNKATSSAIYTVISANESSTYANASSQRIETVPAATQNSYVVTSRISPDLNYANVRYKIGSKECVFSTVFLNAQQPGGYKIPKWSKHAKARGGAICTATITSTKLSTYAWTVDFVMQ